MRLEHHLVGGYVRYISPHIIIINTPINDIGQIPLTGSLQPPFRLGNVIPA